MGAGTRSFQDSEGNVYDLKDNEVNDFLKDFPDAAEVKSFVAGKDTFDIPLNEVADFQKDYPDAKPLGAPVVEKKNDKPSTTATPSSSLDIDKELKGKVSDKDLYDYKQSRDRGVMGQTYIEELKKKNPAIAEFEAKQAAIKATAPTPKQVVEKAPAPKTEEQRNADIRKTIQKPNETPDAYVERMNKQKQEFDVVKRNKEKAEYLQNEDNISNNTVDGYLQFLHNNYPGKYNDIQESKSSGAWNRGADVEEQARIKTESAFGNLEAAYERTKGYFSGETNQDDDANLYLQANNWAAKTQQEILGDIQKTDVFKQYETLGKQLAASPIGKQLSPINEGMDKLSKSKDVLEYQNLAQRGQKQNGKLSEQDYKRYQALAKTKDVAALIELNKGREQLLSTPEGQAYAQAAGQYQQLQSTQEVAQYNKTAQSLNKTVTNLKDFGKQFPKQYVASQIYQNYQKQADSAYKKMNPFLKATVETLDTFSDVAATTGAEILAGGATLLSSGYKLLGAKDTARFADSVANGITSIAQDYSSYSVPNSTQAQLPFSDSFIPYKINVDGKQVAARLYKNAKGEIIDVRDADGYSMFMSQDDIDGVNKLYQDDPNKPAETSETMWGLAFPKLTSTITSLAAIALAPEAGAVAGLSQKASMFAYGYLTSVKGSYDAIKAQDPLISDDAATLYANTMGLVNGGLFLVTPDALLGKKAVDTGYKELGEEYITYLKNGMRPNKAMQRAITSQYIKHGAEGAMFGMGVEIANKGVNGATNELTGRQSVDAEIKLSQLLESGVSMFLATSILGAARGGYRDKIMGDALYTGLKNYDKTLAEFENMANSGQITAQDFNRMTNLMSELKPIYDNLADMGEYNSQYKTALISLYTEKYMKQQKLNAMDQGEQPGMVGKAVNKVKSILTNTPAPNRDALVKELNDIDKSIESMAIVNNPDFIVYTKGAQEVTEEWPDQEEVLSKLRDPKVSLKDKFELYEKYKKQLNNKKFYKNENGDFVPFTSTTLKVGKQYIFDPKTAKFLAIKGAVVEGSKEKQYTASGEEVVQEPKIIGAQVELPKYFSQGEQFTRDQLQEKLKDPAFLADLKAGRVQVDIFNDIEMEGYIENLTKEKLQKERKLLQEGPKALGPGEQITPTEPGPAEVLPDLTLPQLGDKEVITEDGTLATVERGEDGNWYLNLENGKSQQIPVTDNANPSETIKQLGLKLPVEQNVPVAVSQGQKEITGTPIDITVPTGQEVGAVTLNDDGVTFNIPEVGQVTWLKFNYTNKGELKTADVLLPDGKKLKVKDADIVYDMATALSNQTRARLGVTPEVTNGAIEDAVDQIKQTFDKGMTTIYNVVVNAGDAAIHIEKAYEREPLTKQEQAAALDYLVTAANTINKIDTENATEKQNIIDWLSEAYDQVSSAEVTMEGPSELGGTEQGAEGGVATKGEPSTPTKQRIVKHPEITANTQRYLKRIAGDQESIDALTNAIKTAYEEGASPMEAAKALGYAGQEYVRPLETVIKDMQPEITEKEVKAEAPVVEAPVEAKPREFTAEQLKASATKPVVKWASNELSMKGNLEVFDAIAQNTPELAPLMQEAKQVTEQLQELADKISVEGYPLRGNSAEVGLGYKMPFPYRIYSQLYNSTNAKRFDNAAKAIEKFKQEVQDAKKFLANPPSEAEIAKVKALREANVLAAKQKAVSPIAPFDRDAKRRTELGNLKEKAKSLTEATSNSEAVKLLKLALGGTDAEMIKEASQLVGEDLRNTPLITVAEKVGNALMDLADKQLAKLGPAPEAPVVKEEPTQAELMAKPIAMDVLKVETLFNNNGYDISIDYDNEALITNKKTGEQVEFDQLPENMQRAAEVYGEWVSNIADMVGDPMEFVAKTRSEYEGELVPYEEVGPEALPQGRALDFEKDFTQADIQSVVDNIKENGKPLSEFKKGDKIVWASDSNTNYMQYAEGIIRKVGADYEIERLDGAKEKSPKFILRSDALVISKPEGEPEYKGNEDIRKQPTEAEAVTKVEVGKPQYIEGNPVGGTAEVGQYRPEFESQAIQTGKETKIILPDGTEHKAVYVVAPINSVLASHDPNNAFRKTEGYPVDASGNTTNDRDYMTDNSAQTDVQRIAGNPNYDLYLDLGQSVSVGPPVITKDGIVVGGSGRKQAMDLLSPSQRKEMGNAINAKVDAFGFSSQGMENLGVFRMLVDYNEPYSKVSSAKFNQSEGKKKSDADTSLTFGASLNENARAKELLFNTVGAYDTIGDFFNNLAAKRLSKDIMVKNGLVAEKDINTFFDQDGNWTKIGKELFKEGLFATLFDEDIVRLLDTDGNTNFLNKIAKEMPTLATNFKLPADVNLKEEIQEAIKLQTQFQSSGLPDMNTFLRNMPIFDKPSLNSAIMWSLLDMSTVKINTFRGAIQSYTNSAEQAGLPSMFGDAEQVMGKADFMNLILNKVPYEKRQIIKNAFANEGFGPRVEEQGSRYTRSMGAPRPKDGLGRYTRFGEEGQGGQGETVGRVKVYRTTGTGLGGLGVAYRGSGVYYAIDAPFQALGRPGQVSEVEINIDPKKTIDLTTDKGAKVFADIQTEAKKRFDAVPENERGRNLFNDLIRDIAVEKGYDGALSYIEPAAPSGERERIGREYVSYVGDVSLSGDTLRAEEPQDDYSKKYYSKKGSANNTLYGGYDPYSVQGKSVALQMNQNGILPWNVSYAQAVSEYSKFPDIKVFKTLDGKRCFLKIKALNGKYVKFNPFTAVPYDAGRGNITPNPDSVIPPSTSPISEVVIPAIDPADAVLPQAEQDFKNQQLFFDFNDDAQTAQEPGGKYFGFVSAANKIRKMTNLSKNEQEYSTLLNDQVRNKTAAGSKKLAELRDKIGDERATEIQNDVVNNLVEHKLGRQLKPGEYATQTSTVTVSKDKYAIGSTQIKTAADVAYIARMIEGESVENFLLYMLDENGITTLAHIGTGGIAGVYVDPKVVSDHIITFKPKKIWLAHNHPAGTMEASKEDVNLTKQIKQTTDSFGVELAGHVIVDFIDGKYIALDNAGNLLGSPTLQSEYKGAEDEIPVYINGKAATFDWSSNNKITSIDNAIDHLSNSVTALRAGENAKGGFLVLNRANVVIGHFYLTGDNDVQNVIRASSALGGSTVITYGNFNNPIYPIDREMPNGVKIIDHLTYQSERFTSAIYEPEPVYDTTSVTMPNAQELVLPYDRNSTKLQQAVQQAMVDGFLKFDEVMFNLYDGHFGKDVIKMRKALDEVKDAYDNLSFENEDWIDSVSTIKEVAAFNVDNFLKSIQTPQKKTMSLRQQYDDFASWFEYNFPEARPYYKIEFDSELGDAIFTINGEPIQKNGEPISYSRWLNNPSIQKEWHGKDKALVKNQPAMIWVDKDLTPTPKQYITDSSYKLFPFQTHAVNAAIDYFEKGNKGFGLWDGQGVGKTREILAIANEMAARSGKPSLIITKSDNVIDQFKESAGAMSLRGIEYKKDKDSGVIIGTYQDMVGGKVGKLSSYGTVVFDEAHLLKNIGSQRSKKKEDLMDKMDHVVFATGTPMDKPSQLLYFAKYMSGNKLDSVLEKAGLKASSNGKLYPIKKKGGEPLLPEDKGLSDLAIIKKGLLRWRNQMIEDGAMIRREFPFYGTFGALGIDIDKSKINAIDYILSERPGNAGIMEANRYQEHLKIPYVLERVNRALENGKQIVLFCTGVNPTEIKSMGITVPQFASEFSDILTKQGIAHSNIFGDNATQKIEEAKKFQRGETKVAIATISSGGTGIDLDDQVGDAPREVLFVTMPWSADDLDQAIRRVSRLNTKSPSVIDFIFANGSYADEHKQSVVYGKMETMRNIQAGMDPDLVEMNKWKEGDEINVDFEEPQMDSEGDIELAAPAITVTSSALTEPYNPEKEKQKAEKEEFGMLGATSSSNSNLGTSVPPAGSPQPPRQKSRGQRANEWLLGEKRTSIHAKILQAMIDLGVPTAGEYGYNKRWLGVYELLPKSVKLRYSQDMFTAIHETMHWLDYSVMNGLTNDIINNGSHALRTALENLYLGLYPGAKDTDSDELKISEGLAVFMQYKLHDPDLAATTPIVEKEIFSPGGRFYHPKMTEVYDVFRNILDDVQNMSSTGRVSQRIASDTPFDDKFTVSSWNFAMQRMFQNYDESIPLQLWDEAAGDEHTLQSSYFMWRNRGKMAANVVQQDTRALSFMSQPMYLSPNGQWVPLKYRMSDIVKNVTKVVEDNYADIKRIYPEMTTSLDAFRTYLIARRVYFMGVKRVDLETQMANIIADAQQDFRELMTYAKDTPEYEAKLIDFNSNHIRPLRLAAEKWNQVNTIIDNEGGSVKDRNPNFSASLLAFEIPTVHGRITSGIFDNKKGNYISEHDVTEVFNSLNPYMDKAAKMYDFINDKVGIDMAVATGLMSREFANELKFDNALYPGYASFQKHINTTVLEDSDFVNLNGGGTSKLRHNLRWKGSEYAIIDPMMSQASMVFEVFRKGMYNNVLLKLAHQSTLNDEFARGFMKLPTEYIPIKNTKGQTLYLKPQVKGGEPKGVMVQKLYSNGKVKFYAVNDRALFAFFSSIADEYKMLPFTSHWLGKIGMTSKQLLEKMTTGIYPYWMPINYGVDQVTSTINSENGTIPVISSIRHGLPDMIRAAKTGAIKQMQTMSVLNKLFPNRTYTTQQINYVMEYLSLSGSSQTFFAEMERPEVVGALEKMFNAQEGFVNKAKKFFKGSVQTSDSILSLGNDITEVLTRATEYALARKNGKTQEQAMFDAMNITPFAKRGANKLLRIYQLYTPYLKPGMNMSAKQLIEEPRKNPAKTMMIIDAMIGIGALSIFLLWEDLTEDEKNYYRGLDGRTASMYLSVPSKFLGGKEGDIRQFRIPEFVGSFGAMGAMWAIAIMDSKEVDTKQMINAISSNVPSLLNPYDWTMSDKTIPKSVGRNFVANLPPIPKTAAEVFGGKKITYFGTTPIIPRQTESFPTEYQYKLGIGGTSTVAKQISELLNGVASPAEVDLILERQLGRTGKIITDLADNKELKNVFLKTVEDVATNNKFYADFWSRYNDETGEFNVMRNVRYAAKIPKPGEPGYEDWKKEVRQKAETSEIYSSTHFMVMELLKMRDWARLSNNAISIDVYNQMNHLMQGLYDNKSNETLMRDVHDAYRALKQEASRIRYESDVDQFNNFNDITKIDKYQIKLKTKKMIKGIK